ncbi:IS701 family transposase [Bradyrhizobium diazoefficiens]|uniref:IS701 family transposase n=1 Tax=Bradyrhizobium diazoefficiens TaxID=1355477 RepID=UPI00190C5325|nr:IS701 family transposase [Bradyrhizobium diazoefficiens]QQO31601.1 IS701 family transposase [Bradyrhizobium diazoefficiens]QQO32774.1 IS701 family transposase [Bradyrhizobium diazoefficiens]QQO32777.1 IS701 family transposase [Bradyrhizobium diazoefficiens]QQO34556.1 IS701 family transposase [Bradyrhizobium diazoefficiens]QQO34561.1 IS701 family transposase [Bradyrhizobium diazoefficiens]
MSVNNHREAEERFGAYVDGLSSVIGHPRRRRQLRDYCTGLVLPGERKSVEPLAARTDPARTAAQHQSLLHFVGNACWSDEDVLAKVRQMVLPALEKDGPIEAWIIDDTSFPKQGKHSVGVHHQYCGQLGKQANCQVAVSLSIASRTGSLPVDYRLYLPETWAKDRARRKKAGIPKEIKFKTKPEIALDQIRRACEASLPRGVALMDAAYGRDARLRAGMSELNVSYVAGIVPTILMWGPGAGPRRMDKPMNNTGRRDEPELVTAKTLALGLPKLEWCTVKWREGSAEQLTSRFARVRVRVGSNKLIPEKSSAEWLLIEWPKSEAEPTRYWLSTLPETISFTRLVDLAKLRWRIERDYQELKQEVGLGHYEGRGWRGFHHHATLCIAAYGFLVAERATIPPSGPRCAPPLPAPRLPDDYRPRGSALAA